MKTAVGIAIGMCLAAIAATAAEPDVRIFKDSDGNEVVMVGAKMYFGGGVAPAEAEVDEQGTAPDDATVGDWVADNWGKCLLGAVAAGGIYMMGDHNDWWGNGDKDTSSTQVAPPTSVDGSSTPVVVSTRDGSPVSVNITYGSYNMAPAGSLMPWRP